MLGKVAKVLDRVNESVDVGVVPLNVAAESGPSGNDPEREQEL